MSDTIISALISAAIFVIFFYVNRWTERRRANKELEARVRELEIVQLNCPVHNMEKALESVSKIVSSGLVHREDLDRVCDDLGRKISTVHRRVDDLVLAFGDYTKRNRGEK